MPGVPVTGHPLAQEPQTMQAEKSKRSRKERKSVLIKDEEVLTTILAFTCHLIQAQKLSGKNIHKST
jgi:hypothetical protein